MLRLSLLTALLFFSLLTSSTNYSKLIAHQWKFLLIMEWKAKFTWRAPDLGGHSTVFICCSWVLSCVSNCAVQCDALESGFSAILSRISTMIQLYNKPFYYLCPIRCVTVSCMVWMVFTVEVWLPIILCICFDAHCLHIRNQTASCSYSYTAISILMGLYGLYPMTVKSSYVKSSMFFLSGFKYNLGKALGTRSSCSFNGSMWFR